jgi:hypothetical protein
MPSVWPLTKAYHLEQPASDVQHVAGGQGVAAAGCVKVKASGVTAAAAWMTILHVMSFKSSDDFQSGLQTFRYY